MRTIERAAAPTLADFMFSLELAAKLHAIETAFTGFDADCGVCNARVRTIEDRVPMLTSQGTAHVWRPRPPEAHSRACLEEELRRRKARTAHIDPSSIWDRD